MNEAFEGFMKTTFEPEHQFSECDLTTAFLAGAAAMRDRCAEVADNKEMDYGRGYFDQYVALSECAAAMRKIGVE